MLDNNTKRLIDSARDILVGKVPDPKGQIEHITIALIYKFMDDMDRETVQKFGGKAKYFTGSYEKYSWQKLFDPKLGGHDMLALYREAIEKMYLNPNIPDLFKGIFKNAYLSFNSPETLKMFLKNINEFNYDHSENLGNAYEYLLSVLGTQGDAGQFRTPRHIIEFIVACVDPQKHESILDPACGTAGFILSAYKHILKHNDSNFNPVQKDNLSQSAKSVANNNNGYRGDMLNPDEKKRLAENLVGFDIDPNMVRFSLVNMFLHKFQTPRIYEYDTLSSEDRWNEYYDVIVANPPFMSPKGGIKPHKRFSIQATKSEVLFTDYMAEHLTPNGRAGIIVPNGIIATTQTAYKSLRKMLVENYLVAVVSLPAGVFNPYSGVKTSILLLDKKISKQTDSILFIKVENDGYDLGAQRREHDKNDLPEALSIFNKYKTSILAKTEFTLAEPSIATLVKKEKILENKDVNLSAERYFVKIVRNSKFELVKLGEVIDLIMGQAPPGEECNSTGNGVPFVKVGQFGEIKPIINEWTLKPLKRAQEGDVLICVVGATIGKLNLGIDCSIGRSVAALRPDKKRLEQVYLYHLLKEWILKLRDQSQGSAQGVIGKDILNDIEIPLPPLDIQQQIVSEIESYQKIIDGARMVVDNYKPTIKIKPEWEFVDLEKLCEIKSGGTPSRDNNEFWDNGTIPWVGSTVCKNEPINKANEYITKLGYKNSNAKLFKKETTLIALVGATIGKTAFLEFECTTNQNIAGIYPKDGSISNKFLFYISQTLYNQFLKLGDGSFRMASLGFIKELKIPLPSLEEQTFIVSQIEEEQKIVESNKKLIALFEQKIKDRIAEVWGEKDI